MLGFQSLGFKASGFEDLGVRVRELGDSGHGHC